ncbi:hypothetical protein HPP92_022067 [Vanilla planifolia]|uniref:Uncharacterized protein n=1 Tax=Vanilla planifolia TaxID=51239 RepID=A0A835PWM1_VANPL|nr:hypothetical protein HPP92_022067 [Vanilla planifolia]
MYRPFRQTLDEQSSNLSFLKTIITTLEPMPMEFLMEPELAEMARNNIADEVSSLAQRNVGFAELKILHVKVIVEVCDEETNVELLSEKRMSLVTTEEAFEQEESCAICLEDASAGSWWRALHACIDFTPRVFDGGLRTPAAARSAGSRSTHDSTTSVAALAEKATGILLF